MIPTISRDVHVVEGGTGNCIAGKVVGDIVGCSCTDRPKLSIPHYRFTAVIFPLHGPINEAARRTQVSFDRWHDPKECPNGEKDTELREGHRE